VSNVLILGSGARENAIAKKFNESCHVKNIYVIPGNDGIKKDYEIYPGDDFESIYKYIVEKNIDLVFVGNEQYLADGIVNYLSQYHVKIIGPTQAAAMIESSKVYSKDLMKKSSIPTAYYEVFTDPEKAINFIRNKTYPIVIKADGLAAGKGVVIANTFVDAENIINAIFKRNMFGRSGERIIIEEYLSGEEASIFAFCDGENFVSTVFVQDHKRSLDNDEGLNTGGMGAFAPVDKFATLKQSVDDIVFAPILKAMKAEGTPFEGILFAGLMITDDKINVIEFNCRLGDPETQVLLPLLENDLFDICEAILNKKIGTIELRWKKNYALCVVLASKGYPESFEKEQIISIDNTLFEDKKLQVTFAGIKDDNGVLRNSGGRVISLTCLEKSLIDSVKYVYSKIALIKSDILRYRTDIGKKGYN